MDGLIISNIVFIFGESLPFSWIVVVCPFCSFLFIYFKSIYILGYKPETKTSPHWSQHQICDKCFFYATTQLLTKITPLLLWPLSWTLADPSSPGTLVGQMCHPSSGSGLGVFQREWKGEWPLHWKGLVDTCHGTGYYVQWDLWGQLLCAEEPLS